MSTAPAGRLPSRKELKAVTRRRLLDAALRIIDEEGESGLTTTNVARAGGIAQSSFYVHFSGLDDLLHNLIDELALERRRLTRAARQKARSSPLDAEALRETFRVPIRHSMAHPPLFRLLARSRHDRSSPLGDWSRAVLENSRQALVDDLYAAGMARRTAADRRAAAMVADGVIALTEALTVGHMEGRYPDVEEIIDILVAFSWGYFPLLTEARPDIVAEVARRTGRRAMKGPERRT